MEENRARRRLIQFLDKGAESAENGGTLPDPSSAFKFISRISFHGLRGGCSAAAQGQTPPLLLLRYTAAPCNSVYLRNSKFEATTRGGEDPFPTGGWENGEEIRDRGRVLFPFFLFFFPFFLFFTLVRVLGFHRGSVENLGTSRKFLVARRASNSSCFPSLPPLGTLKSLQRGASLGELRINAPRANDEFSSENSL